MGLFCERASERENTGSLSGIAVDSFLVGCDDVSLGGQFQTSGKTILSSWYTTTRRGGEGN